MNDPTETEYAATLIRSTLTSREAIAHLATVGNKKRQQKISGQLTEAINQILGWYVDSDEHYLTCFCENGDLLSQWRGYGSVGGGYAVGFLAEHIGLVQYENREKPEPVLRKVIYDAKLQQRLTLKWVKFIIDWQSFCLESHAKAEVDHWDFGWHMFNWFLSQSLRCFKHPAYEEEEEWRVIQVGTAPTGKRAVEPNFRAGRRGIVEYVELDLPGAEDRLPMEVICYGPTLDPTVTDRSLSLLCRGKGYDKVRIVKSNVPFAG